MVLAEVPRVVEVDLFCIRHRAGIRHVSLRVLHADGIGGVPRPVCEHVEATQAFIANGDGVVGRITGRACIIDAQQRVA